MHQVRIADPTRPRRLITIHGTPTDLIPAEQKRRQAIREGFDRLCDLVPGMEGQGRSEGLVLQKTVQYLQDQLDVRRQLIETIEQSGGHVDDSMKT